MSAHDYPWRDSELLRRKYIDEGLSQSEIAEEFGCRQPTIHKWLDRHDIEPRTPTQEQSGPWRDETVLKRLYVENNLTIPEIAEELGCGKTTVHRWLQRHGINRRKSGGRREWASFLTMKRGYEVWRSRYRGETDSVRHHRLLAVAEFGFDAVADRVVHHGNGVKWDNRPENLEIMTVKEHSELHFPERERAKNGDFVK